MTTPAPAAEAADTTTAAPDADVQPDADEQTPDAADADEHDDDQRDDDQRDDDADDQDDGDDKSKASRQAARYRTERNEARDELAASRLLLATQQSAIIDAAISAAGYDRRLFDAAEIELDQLVDDRGVVDPAKVTATVARVAAEFHVQPQRRPRPTPGQGSGGSGPGASTWASVLGGATRR